MNKIDALNIIFLWLSAIVIFIILFIFQNTFITNIENIKTFYIFYTILLIIYSMVDSRINCNVIGSYLSTLAGGSCNGGTEALSSSYQL